GGGPAPVVVIAVGYPGAAVQGRSAFKEMAFVCDWARWFAASGMAAVTYTTRTPADDLAAVLTHAADGGRRDRFEGSRIGLFAQSGNAPVGLSALLTGSKVRPSCAVFTYGFMFDANGTTAVADAARQFGFANPCAGRSIDDVDASVPTLIVRAGRDEFQGLNASIDAYVAGALRRNLP